MSDRWVNDHRRDSWRRQAKSSGYRARSAFKLKQIQDRFVVIREGDVVLDVGCHPGGWSQVAVELVGEGGAVIGVDLQPCIPVDGAKLLVGDITDPASQKSVLEELDGRAINSVVSDISPDITGNWDIDQNVAMTLVASVCDFSLPLLCRGGSFVAKLFQGIGVEELIECLRPHFSKVRRFSPTASRNSSSEVYLVCKHYLRKSKKPESIRESFEKALDAKRGYGAEDEHETAPVSFRVIKRE